MNKLDFHLPSLTYPKDVQLDTSAPRRASIHTSLEPARRLIVLIPADSDYQAATRRIWELANAMGSRVQFLGLCRDAAQEPNLRRGLVTMSALLQAGRVSAEAKVEIGTNWVNVVKRNYQTGDMIVCFAEQNVGLLHRPLSQILYAKLNAPIYILSGLSLSQDWAQTTLLILSVIGEVWLIWGWNSLFS